MKENPKEVYPFGPFPGEQDSNLEPFG